MRYRLIVDDWGRVGGKDAEFESFEQLREVITICCEDIGWPVPELREGLPGAGDGVFQRTDKGWRKIAEPA